MLRAKTNAGDTRVKYVGPKYWNSQEIAHNLLSESLDTFKHRIKDYYIDAY